MSLDTRLQAFVTRVATEFKALRAVTGDKANLQTGDKSSLVAALNELKAALSGAAGINDAATASTTTWSSQKTQAAIDAAVTALVNGAATDGDTLKELADRITALAQADAGLVSAAQAQSFNATQQAQARSNIGAASAAAVGDTEQDLVAAFNTALA